MKHERVAMEKTSKTFSSQEAAAAFMMGFHLGNGQVDCEVWIDPEEPEAVNVDLNGPEAYDEWLYCCERFKEDSGASSQDAMNCR
jgi:hypothetical protein